jgi:hypothetical protein
MTLWCKAKRENSTVFAIDAGTNPGLQRAGWPSVTAKNQVPYASDATNIPPPTHAKARQANGTWLGGDVTVATAGEREIGHFESRFFRGS